jgi:hypothetical protein
MFLLMVKINSKDTYNLCYKFLDRQEAQRTYELLLETYPPSKLSLIETTSFQFGVTYNANSLTPEVSSITIPIATTDSAGSVQLATLNDVNINNPIDNKQQIPLVPQPSLIVNMINQSMAYTTSLEPTVSTVKEALDDLYVKTLDIQLDVISFTTPRNLFDIGSSSEVIFQWEYNKDITSQSLNNVSLEPSIRTTTLTLTGSQNVELVAHDVYSSVTKLLPIYFTYRIFWGVSNQTENIDETFILNLGNSRLATNYYGEYEFDQGSNEYGYIACPSNYNMPSVCEILNWQTDLLNLGTLLVTNDYNITTLYQIYRTTDKGLGSYFMTFKAGV